MATKAKVKTRPAPKAAPVLPDSCGVALTKKQVSHAMSITTRCLDTMIARGDYPRPDFHIGPLPRWRVAVFHGPRHVDLAQFLPLDG